MASVPERPGDPAHPPPPGVPRSLDGRERPPEVQVLQAAVAFARSLRSFGLNASVDSELVFIRTLTEIDVRNRSHVYWAGHATFVHSPDERPVFDSIFERWWEGRELLIEGRGSEHGESDARSFAT